MNGRKDTKCASKNEKEFRHVSDLMRRENRLMMLAPQLVELA